MRTLIKFGIADYDLGNRDTAVAEWNQLCPPDSTGKVLLHAIA
jgi:hypothetical protein